MPTDKKNLYLASEVHVLAGGEPEKPGDPKPIKTVGPGLLSELGLSDKQLEKIPRGVVRAATADEIEAGETRARNAKVAEVRDEMTDEQRNAEIERENERKIAEKKIEEQKAKTLAEIEEAHAKERAKEQQKTAAELNKAAGAKK